jgi:hypothetical protein
MNKKRRTLTVVALIAFGAIIALHYLPSGDYQYPREEWLLPVVVDHLQ